MGTRAVTVTLALLAAIGAGSASAASPHGAELSRLDSVLASGVLRVCSTGDYRPFSYLDPDTKQWSGVDIDLASDLAARLGVRRVIVPTTWATLSKDFDTKCDIAMGGVSITLNRAKLAFFSKPYLVDGKTPITKCGNVNRFQTLEQIDQPGVRIIVNPGGTNERFVHDRLPKATVVSWPDNNTIFDHLLTDGADLMITDASETRWQAARHPQLCSVHPDQPFDYAQKAYLLPRGDVVWQQWVDQWLNLAQHDGTWDRIAKPWLGLVG